MQSCQAELTLAELNFLLATAARQPSAREQAHAVEQRVRGRLVSGLTTLSGLVLLYDAVLLAAA